MGDMISGSVFEHAGRKPLPSTLCQRHPTQQQHQEQVTLQSSRHYPLNWTCHRCSTLENHAKTSTDYELPTVSAGFGTMGSILSMFPQLLIKRTQRCKGQEPEQSLGLAGHRLGQEAVAINPPHLPPSPNPHLCWSARLDFSGVCGAEPASSSCFIE